MASKPEVPPSSNENERPTESDTGKKPIVTQQIYTTGNKWQDFKLAVQRISFWDDLKNIGQIPCARSSLLMGIGAGTGVGFVRGMNAKPIVAANWAMGTFVVVSIGAWNVCRASMRRERQQVRAVVEKMAERKLRPSGTGQEDPKDRG